LKNLEEGRKKKKIGISSLESAALNYSTTQVPEKGDPSWSAPQLETKEQFQPETVSFSTESVEAIISILDENQKEAFLNFDLNTDQVPPESTLSPEVLNEIEILFDQLYLSFSDNLPVPQNEISSADLILRERTEQLDLLFDLLHGSFSSPQPKQEKEETQSSEIKPKKNSPRIEFPKEQLESPLWNSSDNLPNRAKEPQNERHIEPSALNLIIATIVDLALSQVFTIFGLLIYEGFFILKEPTLTTIADQIFCFTIFLALFVPSFCLYRAACFLFIGLTPGFFITGIKPIALDGSKPSRYRLVLLSFTAPFVRLLTIPFFLTNRGTKFLTKLTEVRLLMFTPKFSNNLPQLPRVWRAKRHWGGKQITIQTKNCRWAFIESGHRNHLWFLWL
jgi:hypothetical protein